MAEALYDRIGQGYAQARRPDPRIQAAIEEGLGDAESVLNVGAGAGGYEPADREVTAVEPSAEMIAQRAPDAAPVIQASAEALPFDDDSFDAAMARAHRPPLARHGGRAGGAAPGRARAGRRSSPTPVAAARTSGSTTTSRTCRTAAAPSAVVESSATPSVSPVPIPRDCTDLFFFALWARPELFLDDEVVQSMWIWNMLDPAGPRRGARRLAADLADGTWEERHGSPPRGRGRSTSACASSSVG